MSVVFRTVPETDWDTIRAKEEALVVESLGKLWASPARKVSSPDFHGVIGGPYHVISRLLADEKE